LRTDPTRYLQMDEDLEFECGCECARGIMETKGERKILLNIDCAFLLSLNQSAFFDYTPR